MRRAAATLLTVTSGLVFPDGRVVFVRDESRRPIGETKSRRPSDVASVGDAR